MLPTEGSDGNVDMDIGNRHVRNPEHGDGGYRNSAVRGAGVSRRHSDGESADQFVCVGGWGSRSDDAAFLFETAAQAVDDICVGTVHGMQCRLDIYNGFRHSVDVESGAVGISPGVLCDGVFDSGGAWR